MHGEHAFPVVYGGRNGFCNRADFSEVDFRTDSLDFSGFIFGDRACFRAVQWGDSANFQNASWGDYANFSGSQWGDYANFQDARWGEGAIFIDSQWGGKANFSRARWEYGAIFLRAQWGDGCYFRSAWWERGANFVGALWADRADFEIAQWGERARFVGAKWGACTNFSGAKWGYGADFKGAEWGYDAGFRGARWETQANFMYARWGFGASFEGAQWGGGANFEGTQWDNVYLNDAMWGGGVDFRGSFWIGDTDFSGSDWKEIGEYYKSDEHLASAIQWAELRGLAPDMFQAISFAGAHFAGEVNFSNRKFTGKTDFGRLPVGYQRKRVQRDNSGRAKFDEKSELLLESDLNPRCHICFDKAPKFHGCELHQDSTFDRAEFPPVTGSDEAARAYRTLKLAFSKQQALREEQRFFRLEMEEEALREQGLKRRLFWAYKHFSDYGFSVWRPLCWALGASAVMAMLYGLLSVLGNCLLADVATCHFAPDWLTFSLLQTLPVPGVDKMIEAAGKVFLPADDWWGLGVSVLVIFHKAVVIAALFLVGLALRNLFRLK